MKRSPFNFRPLLGDAAERAVRFTVARRREDSLWPYGEAQSQGWIDSFNSGFVLVSLKHFIEFAEDGGVERGA